MRASETGPPRESKCARDADSVPTQPQAPARAHLVIAFNRFRERQDSIPSRDRAVCVSFCPSEPVPLKRVDIPARMTSIPARNCSLSSWWMSCFSVLTRNGYRPLSGATSGAAEVSMNPSRSAPAGRGADRRRTGSQRRGHGARARRRHRTEPPQARRARSPRSDAVEELQHRRLPGCCN